jgi:hypothetical protein
MEKHADRRAHTDTYIFTHHHESQFLLLYTSLEKYSIITHKLYSGQNLWGNSVLQLAVVGATGCIFFRLVRVLLLIPVLHLFTETESVQLLTIHPCGRDCSLGHLEDACSFTCNTFCVLFLFLILRSNTMRFIASGRLLSIYSSPLSQDYLLT